MLYRFIGKYTGGRTSVNACGVIFEDREPSDVTEIEALRRLAGHPEFEAVEMAAEDEEAVEMAAEDEEAPVEAPKPKRGRPRKVGE